MQRVSLTVVLMIAIPFPALAQQKSTEQQVAQAVSPLPESIRGGATVLGYRNGSTLDVLREGDNEMICLAPNPESSRFHASCYHRDLEPYMARGRELRLRGITGNESRSTRFKEIEAGALKMPNHPMALHSVTGGTFNPETASVDGGSYLHVIYVPYATQETLGVSHQASRERPWLMHPGTPGAHIMISGSRTPGNN